MEAQIYSVLLRIEALLVQQAGSVPAPIQPHYHLSENARRANAGARADAETEDAPVTSESALRKAGFLSAMSTAPGEPLSAGRCEHGRIIEVCEHCSTDPA